MRMNTSRGSSDRGCGAKGSRLESQRVPDVTLSVQANDKELEHGLSATTWRVVPVDDNAMVRNAIRLLLGAEPTWHIVGEGSNGHDAVDVCRRLQPDRVLDGPSHACDG